MRYRKLHRFRPITDTEYTDCPKCGEKVELDHPLAAGSPDEIDPDRLIGECPNCGHLINEEREPFEDCDLD